VVVAAAVEPERLLSYCNLIPAYCPTVFGSVSQSPDGMLNVPKKDLVAAPLILFQDGRLLIADELPMKDTLIKELLNFRVKVNISTKNESYEAWREGDHDDLVLATSLACWVGEKYMPYQKKVFIPGAMDVGALG
jgi:hypothetical protein